MSYSSNDSEGKFWGSVITLILLVIFYLWFYSASCSGTGVITSKWTESHTSCSTDDDGHTSCHTSTTYLVQFDDGSVYGVFWNTRDWDRMMVGSTIKFEARGRKISFLGWRIMQPDIFSFEVIKGPKQ
jgi:hypothetical protein